MKKSKRVVGNWTLTTTGPVGNEVRIAVQDDQGADIDFAFLMDIETHHIKSLSGEGGWVEVPTEVASAILEMLAEQFMDAWSDPPPHPHGAGHGAAR
jgi:hypothetical protein